MELRAVGLTLIRVLSFRVLGMFGSSSFRVFSNESQFSFGLFVVGKIPFFPGRFLDSILGRGYVSLLCRNDCYDFFSALLAVLL